MGKVKAIILVCSTLALGFVIGGLLVGYVVLEFETRAALRAQQTGACSSALQNVRVLNHLRQGEAQEPIEYLEMQLDSDLISLWSLSKDMPVDTRDAELSRTLAKIRDYRAKYPRKTEHPETDQMVAEVLAWAQ